MEIEIVGRGYEVGDEDRESIRKRFDRVGRQVSEHARLEGEGDLSLEGWRDAHRRFFAETAPEEPPVDDATMVVLERFRVVYQES